MVYPVTKTTRAYLNPFMPWSTHLAIFLCPPSPKGRIEQAQGLPATLVCQSGVNGAGWSGCGRSERTLTRVCKFQKTPNKHCEQPAACVVQAHCESTEGSEEQAVPGHVSRSSSFWAQFHLLPSSFLLSGLQRLGSWEGLRDTGLGPPFISCTSP